MASFVYNVFRKRLIDGGVNMGSADMRLALVMTNTTCDTEKDKLTFAGFTTIDEFDGTGYSTGGEALLGEATSQDDVNNRAEFDGTDHTFSSLGAGTRNIAAAVLYEFVTNFNASIPAAYIDTGGFPITANGGDVAITWNAEGIIQL